MSQSAVATQFKSVMMRTDERERECNTLHSQATMAMIFNQSIGHALDRKGLVHHSAQLLKTK